MIEELCYEMGLHRLEAMEEYAIFLVTNRGVLTDVCFSLSHTLKHSLNVVLVHKVNLLVVVSEADPLTDHISGCSLVSSCRRKSLMFMSPDRAVMAK